jgi:F-type H+-transporting ATPase subunit b
MLNPNPGLILWTIVTFVLLLVILRKLAWKPLLAALQRREDSVRLALEQAGLARHEAERLQEENRARLGRAELEGRRIVTESRHLAEKIKEEIVQKANQQSHHIIEDAHAEIERNKQTALKELRGEVAQLAIQAAGKILDETLDDARQRKIIDAYLKELPKN